MDKFLVYCAIALSITAVLCMIRVIIGPTKGDRIIGINIIGTKTMVILAIVSVIMDESYFIDVVLVYALVSFVGSFIVAREIHDAEESELT